MVKKKRTLKKSNARINKKYTFKCNNSDILNQLLTNFGFREETGNKIVDFSMWNTYISGDIKSKYKCINKKLVDPIDNKHIFYTIMKKYNLDNHTPKTYLVSELISDILERDKLYFLKYIHGAGGRSVYPVKTMDDIHRIVREDKLNYILQEEVPNMYLYKDKYKTTMRNYVLVSDKGIYFYNEGYVYIYKTKYDKENLDNSIHNNIFTQCDYEPLSKQYYYPEILPKLCEISSQLLHRYFRDIPLKDSYIILGIDFIIDKTYKPYLIEINGLPNLSSSCGEGSVKKQMIQDFVNLYVLPKVIGKRYKRGGWIKI